MQKQPKTSISKTISLTVVFYALSIFAILLLINACRKSTPQFKASNTVSNSSTLSSGNNTETSLLAIAAIRKSPDDNTVNQVLFYQRQEVFNVPDAATLVILQQAYNNKQMVQVTTDPWKGIVKQAVLPATQPVSSYGSVSLSTPLTGVMHPVNAANISEDINTPQAINIPSPTPGLTSVIPDLATAQLMFTFFAKQSCSLPAPYGIDQCIAFQYVIDGCYARAHKMGWIIENKYHYRVQKLFSYGYLSVRANKWGGCCVNWWFHVAPLVTIKTPTGLKSYIMDPGMFDGPVLMSTWLQAQGNKDCSSSAGVTAYSIQPEGAYWPLNSSTPIIYGTDSDFSSTNATMVSYSKFNTCY